VLRQGIVLEDDAGFGKIHCQLVHVGLRILAMRALEIGEFHQFQVLRGRTAVRSIATLLQNGPILCKRIFAEGNKVVSGDDVLAVGKSEELQRRGLLLPGLVAHKDHDLAHALDRRLQNRLHLPHAPGIEAPTGGEKGVDGLFGRRRGGEIRRIRLGKRRSGGRWSQERRPGLLHCGRGRRLLLRRGREHGQRQGNQCGHAGHVHAGKMGGRTDQADSP
jgi:hypothetical protein